MPYNPALTIFFFFLEEEQQYLASHCTISSASAMTLSGKLGLHCLPGRPSSQKTPWPCNGAPCVQHSGHQPCCIYMHSICPVWAMFRLVTFLLILCSFIYVGVSSTNSCCVRELIIFLSRYYFLPAYFCLRHQWK